MLPRLLSHTISSILGVARQKFTTTPPKDFGYDAVNYAVAPDRYLPYFSPGKKFCGLFLPGDASRGAYAAGIVAGLLRNPTVRYNVIVGYSSGGLITLFTYARACEDLVEFVQKLDTKQVLKKNNTLFSLLFGSGFADNTPLKNYLSHAITNSVIDSMVQQYENGSRAFIVVSDIRVQKPIIWDIGYVASLHKSYDERRAILTKVAIASTALPAIFTPVEFSAQGDKKQPHMCADGAITANFGVKQWMLPTNFARFRAKKWFIIQTSEFPETFPPVKSRIPNIAIKSLATAFLANYHGSKRQLTCFGKQRGMDVFVNKLPPNAPLHYESLNFSNTVMMKAFNSAFNSVENKTLVWERVENQ